jgi:hypothetical protein
MALSAKIALAAIGAMALFQMPAAPAWADKYPFRLT